MKSTHMSNNMRQLKFGELFCGAGGLAYGALTSYSNDHKLGLVHAWANDYDEDSCQTYIKNICEGNKNSVYCTDVCKLDLDSLSKIEAFAYGFPCNSFSVIGKHKGISDKKFGRLYYYGIKVLQKFRPLFFIAENVSGIKSAGSNAFLNILNDMRDSGYKLVVNLYKSEEYGIPQIRNRIIIVGIREDQDVTFHIPDPTEYKKLDTTAKTALLDIPDDAANNEIRKLSEKVIKRLSYIKPGQNVWQAEPNLPEELRIKTKTRISQIYRKLDPEKPSYTLTASGGGGTFGYHWTNRELTNRERARLQTFPDSFKFIGNYASVRRQIGMAVPCRLSRIITTAILNSFAGIEYPWVKSNITLRKKGL